MSLTREQVEALRIGPAKDQRDKWIVDLCDTALAWRREADAALAKLASLRRPSVMRPPMELPEDDEAESDRRALVEAAIKAWEQAESDYYHYDGDIPINPPTIEEVADRVLSEFPEAGRESESAGPGSRGADRPAVAVPAPAPDEGAGT